MLNREDIEWCDSWVAGANDDRLPRILMIGDSITRSYYGTVQEKLAGRFLCARLATSRSICDAGYERELNLILDDYTFAVVHINNGLHGWSYDESTYGRSLARILDYLALRAQDSQLIWAQTTPVWDAAEPVTRLSDRTARVRTRNELALHHAEERQLPVNDLFSLVVDRPELMARDGVHFNPDGQRVLGEQVARTICEQAPHSRSSC